MTTKLNYGPRLRLGEVKNKQSGKQIIISGNSSIDESIRDYSKPETDLKNIKYYPKSHLATPQSDDSENETLSLGSHWKQVATVDDSSFYSQKTITNQPIVVHKKKMNNAENVELCRVVNLQHDNIDEIQLALGKTRRILNNCLQKSAKNYYKITTNGQEIKNGISNEIDELESKNDDFLTKMNEKCEELLDNAHQMIDIIEKKNRMTKLVEKSSKHLIGLSNISLFIESNMKRIENSKNLIDYSIFERKNNDDLTIFEHEDHRIHQSISKFYSFIRNLPLEKEEKQKMESIIEKTETMNGKMKCEMIFRELLTIMSKWNDDNEKEGNGTKSGISTNNWQNIKGPFDDSSFYLTDSNLSDLEQEIDSSKIRQAVQGPNNCIEFAPWSSASSITSWNTNGNSSIQSLYEPMTLSSYEMRTSSWGSTTNSSLDEQLTQMRTSLNDDNDDGCDLKTAFSADQIVCPKTRRSLNQLEKETDNQLSAPCSSISTRSDVLSFSSISLVDMIDDALHTAKHVVDNNTHNLMTALHDSANKCGVPISNLMSNTSSSESESTTQASTPHKSTRTSAEKTELSQNNQKK